MKFKYVFEAPDDFEPGCCANCPLSIIDWGNDQDLSCSLNCDYEECPLEQVKENRKEVNKMTKQLLINLADTLHGNINRMMVTDDQEELLIMYMWAERILHTIHKERLNEMEK